MKNNQQLKPKSERIIPFASIIFGILSILANASTLVPPKLYSLFPSTVHIIWYYFMGFSLFGGGMFFFPIIGFILGIKSRKSKLGITGVILSMIGFISALYLTLVFIRIFQ